MPAISMPTITALCRRLVLPLCVSAVLAGCVSPGWMPQAGQSGHRFSAVVPVAGQYLVYLPAGFDAHAHKLYPLLIFLHGSGESGSDITRVKAHGPPEFLDSRADFPFIVVSPQAPDEVRGFELQTLDALLARILARLPVDRQRIYLTGLSMGGITTYEWAAARPGVFAAIAPVSGVWLTVDGCALKDTPIWAFHGAKDDVVREAEDAAMVAAIKVCGGDVRYTVYPELGHSAWDPAYADPALYQWLLGHTLKRQEPTPPR